MFRHAEDICTQKVWNPVRHLAREVSPLPLPSLRGPSAVRWRELSSAHVASRWDTTLELRLWEAGPNPAPARPDL